MPYSENIRTVLLRQLDDSVYNFFLSYRDLLKNETTEEIELFTAYLRRAKRHISVLLEEGEEVLAKRKSF